MNPCFFISPQSVPILGQGHRYYESRFATGRLNIVSCQRPLQKPTKQLSPSQSDENRGGLILSPKRAPSLLRGPESVLAILGLGFLTTAAFLANFTRRVTGEVSARAKMLMEERNITSRLQTRLRDRSFLQSAVDATKATLQNTTSFLEAQNERAHIAEARLSRLEVQHTDLRNAEHYRERLVIELAAAEAELKSGEQAVALEERDLADLRGSVEESRRKLTAFDKDQASAKAALKLAEEEAQRALEAEHEKISALEAEVRAKDTLIKEALKSNQRTDEDVNVFEQQVTQLNNNVTNALTDIEEQRKVIDKFSNRIHSVKVDVERKRDLQSTQQKLRLENMQDEVRRFSKLQDTTRQALSELNERNAKQEAERRQLQNELMAREESLRNLQVKLLQMDLLDESESADLNETLTDLTADFDTPESEIELADSNKKGSLQDSNLDTSARDAALRGDASESTVIVEKSTTKPLQKRSRGRPRKADKEQQPTAVKDVKTKRGRGRPRKTEPRDETETTTPTMEASTLKRKRPKKDSVRQTTS